ncbi:lysozyme inhibitor LprI family protein [Sphingomonas sp. CD22]|uniref:lysozyme inhibitor LprI family protein n=1 Tax=Sphingomonas sp. CD22 TaxID=3100214 RepID=UPI003A103782
MHRTSLFFLAALFGSFCGGGAAGAASTASSKAACWQQGTTAAISACFAASSKEADRSLNQLYGRVMSVLDPGDQQKLRNAQRLWVRYRDASCNAERSLWDGGTGGNPAYLACLDDVTRHRLDYLQVTYRLRLQRAKD